MKYLTEPPGRAWDAHVPAVQDILGDMGHTEHMEHTVAARLEGMIEVIANRLNAVEYRVAEIENRAERDEERGPNEYEKARRNLLRFLAHAHPEIGEYEQEALLEQVCDLVSKYVDAKSGKRIRRAA